MSGSAWAVVMLWGFQCAEGLACPALCLVLCVDAWLMLCASPPTMCSSSHSWAVRGWGQAVTLGLLLRFTVALSQKQKPHWICRKWDWKRIWVHRAFALQLRRAAEESASQVSWDKFPSDRACCRGSWCFPSSALCVSSTGSSLPFLLGTFCRRQQQISLPPSCAFHDC